MSDTTIEPASSEDMSEYLTRKTLIDKSLERSGWKKNVDWLEEVELEGMPNQSKVGFADYVLYGDDGRPLAVVEAKRTIKDPEVGRQQAILYAELIEKKYRRMPVVFCTNGYETFIREPGYPERKVSEFYSKRDLEKVFNLVFNRSSKLSDAIIDDEITNRYYQKAAIKAICESFENRSRKALVVMATGSGKTRTVVSLVDVLIHKGWVKNVLFLADRTSLVNQAYGVFSELLPSLSVTNLCNRDYDKNARAVFSTYQTMMNLIDTVKDEDGQRVFTNGHFDLLIVDEAHRSIYNKYRSIFDYFDSLMVGLTATPKDEIDKNTYSVFNLPKGEPTYAYGLAQAIDDGYLVNYRTIISKFKFLEDGITYVDLTEEEREEYEDCFTDEDGIVPEKIESSKLNEWVFNRDTIVRVLDIFMRNALKVNSGSMVGKTIIFAKNHLHAEAIHRVFHDQYPSCGPEFCRIIDNHENYHDELIRRFKQNTPFPQIAISVDMMDTGIDVPEILNLVFFKKVYSKSKFWQMIGRGTRLCPGLIDGDDKDHFLIFDFCSNFEFFDVNPQGIESNEVSTIQGRIFVIKADIVFRLQSIEFHMDELMEFRSGLVEELVGKVRELNRDDFSVRQHLRHVDHYSDERSWEALDLSDMVVLNQELSSLIQPYEGDIGAVRMDALMSKIELTHLAQLSKTRLFRELRDVATALSYKTTIPDITAKMDTIKTVLTEGYLERCGISEFESIRKDLRELIKYLKPNHVLRFNTDFMDTVLDVKFVDPQVDDIDLSTYREKAEHYIRKHADQPVIQKLHTNMPLTDSDIEELQNIMWSELGSKDDYMAEYGSKPLGLLVREIVGLDINAAKQAFSHYLDESELDSKQIYFVNQIIEYVVQNGVITDMSVLSESPFNDRGSISELFSNMVLWKGIRGVIDEINHNAGV